MNFMLPSPGILKTCIPLFSLLTDGEMVTLIRASHYRAFPSKRQILRPGQRAEGLYVLVGGSVNLMLEHPDRPHMMIDTLRAPEYFGEAGLFNLHEEHFSIVCREDCATLCMPLDIVRSLTARNPEAGMLIMQSLATRLAQMRRKLADLVFGSVQRRVAHILLELAHEVDGRWLVDIGTTEIAARVGASREMVCRVLARLIARGALCREARKLIVLDRRLLSACAEPECEQPAPPWGVSSRTGTGGSSHMAHI
jgi:CRP/FNR family transcriptional regulator, cyclic AMP receptor protein